MNHYTATYSPDDNKLRLYSTSRLDTATYERVRDAGFIWAPKQDCFVAPMWTPAREDLLLELCGEIADDDKSLADRAQERAERFSGYRDNRTRDAEQAHAGVKSITSNMPLGQPILVGHHSEGRARRDAERIENGMRKALRLWDAADYWRERAAAALAHARYKERPAVRARRIKGLEADLRKQERNQQSALDFCAAWHKVNDHDAALALSYRDFIYRCFTLTAYRRDATKSQYEGEKSLYAALSNRIINHEQARAIALQAHARTIQWCERRIAHYQNRLVYERAMLAEQGGLAAHQHDIQVGGRVLVGRDWLVVMRCNKKDGALVSVTTSRRYVPVVGVEEIRDYQAPTAAQKAVVEAATRLGKLANYPGEGFIHMTQERYDRVPKDYKGTRNIPATATHGKHRVRRALGIYALSGEKDFNKRHAYYCIFITDAKRIDPPAPSPAPVAASRFEVCREPPAAKSAPEAQPTNEARDTLRAQLKAGVQAASAPQLFVTPEAIAARMIDLARPPIGARVLEPSAGTGALLAVLPGVSPFPGIRQTACHVVAVEKSRPLAEQLRASGPAQEVRCADFLECNDLGDFDTILMNPPFANADDIRHIEHALPMLRTGGRLVAICANGPRQQERLCPLVASRGGQWIELPDGSFAEQGTHVRTALIVIPATP